MAGEDKPENSTIVSPVKALLIQATAYNSVGDTQRVIAKLIRAIDKIAHEKST